MSGCAENAADLILLSTSSFSKSSQISSCDAMPALLFATRKVQFLSIIDANQIYNKVIKNSFGSGKSVGHWNNRRNAIPRFPISRIGPPHSNLSEADGSNYTTKPMLIWMKNQFKLGGILEPTMPLHFFPQAGLHVFGCGF